MSSALPFLSILISLISPSFCFSSSRPTGFWAPIINRNSIHSPFRNPNLTRSDRIKASVHRSFARHNYLNFLASPTLFTVPAEPADAEYVMEYYIGTPAMKTYSILDTGSAATWLQCLPCQRCHDQPEAPIFDPMKSSSYRRISCNDDKCMLAHNGHCETDDGICQFLVSYRDNTLASGYAAEETLQFYSSDYKNEIVTVEDFIIGCSHYTRVRPTELTPGLIGLSRDPGSFISQLSYKRFAYCFGDHDDINTYGYIKFGDAAEIRGFTTPIQAPYDDDFLPYNLYLEDISVDNTSISVPDGTFDTQKDDYSGFIIDSGTTYTYIKTAVFDLMVGEIKRKMQNMKSVNDPNGLFDLCYEIYWLDIRFASVITFHFTNLDLELPLWNTWDNIQGDIYCLAMLPTDGISMLGNYQQQNYNVGHDLENNVVSFDFNYCSQEDLL